MCKGTVNREEFRALHPETFHPAIRHYYSGPIDVDLCIADEVEQLLINGVATIGHSCCGHGKLQSQVFIRPEYADKARELGYEVLVIHDPTWEEGGEEFSIKLRSGTQNKPLFGVRVHF